MTAPTEEQVSAELYDLERLDDTLLEDGGHLDGITGAIRALRERMTPGQVTTMERNGMRKAEAEGAMIAANWRLGLSDQRPMTALKG